jgi:hypothetical protein
MIPENMSKNVSVSEAKNGYVVSSCNEKGEVKIVCKDMAEVHKAVEKIMGGSSKKKPRYKV